MQEKAGEMEQSAVENNQLNISHTAGADKISGEIESFNYGKFSNATDLLNAYNSLESEFTRRCQKAKELERENERLKKLEKTYLDSNERVFREGKSFQEKYPETEKFLSKLYEIAAKDKDEAQGFMERAYVKYLKTELDNQNNYYESNDYVNKKVNEVSEVKDRIIREYLQNVQSSKPISRHYTGNGQGIVTPPLKPTTLTEANVIARKIFENSKEIK